jgi:biopolymer transport protein ExbD
MARAITSSGGWARNAAPMVEMNTTPLIDIMLVLLIMFIITVPTQTHQVEVALPRQGKPPPPDWVRPLRNDLSMSANGQLSWNEHAISDGQLASLLAEVADLPKPPEVHFRPDSAARFERVDQVLAIAARSGASTFGFVGNEQYNQVF